jgi:predicted ATPase
MLSPKRYQQIDRVFQAALAYECSMRAAYLDRACADDPDLRGEVEALLSSDEQAGSFIESPALEMAPELIIDSTENADYVTFDKGKIIGNYRLETHLGAGGMGRVYLAEDIKLGRRVALKLLDPRLNDDPHFRSRFFREACLASTRNHPNICTIYEINNEGDLPFIAMEYVEGETLREKINNQNLDLATTLDIALQIADALGEAHAYDIIHRDLKPDNVIINSRGHVKILDFGLAKKIATEADEESQQILSREGMILGTVAYMSPEQAQGFEVDARTDVWSFGVVLYEMLSGRRPFNGAMMTNLLAAILCGEPESLRKSNVRIPDELEFFVHKALRKDPDERYKSGRDLFIELQRLRNQLEIEGELEGGVTPPEKRQVTPKKDKQIAINEKETLIIDSPPVSVQTAPPNNLTKGLLPIIGREKEIAEIKNLLLQENVRLVTMTGVGGTGKTRLSQEIAQELLRDFPEGVFFINLAAITNFELVASTIAQSLGVKEAGGKPVIELLKDYLRDKRMLFVVDNFEQVIDARPQIAELLATAPKLKILITSRVLLHLSTEREFAVLPLDLPEGDASDSLDELSNYEAIRLFAQRAQNAKSSFNLTKENAKIVAEICSRLDGLPLAIELAAARVKILTPQMILSKLENRLNLLTGGARDLPARQQTMHGAIQWSYELLSEEEKRLFRQFAVFAGGFTFEAAESVVGEDAGKKLEINQDQISASQINVLDTLTSLVDKSLLVSKVKADGEIRFRMLEVVREYALESLEASGEAEMMRRNHAAYFLRLGEEAEPKVLGGNSMGWLNRLEEEYDNLRAAFWWALEQEPQTATRLAAALIHFWIYLGHLTEGCRCLKAALEKSDIASAAIRFKLLNGLGGVARYLGNYETARKAYDEALATGKATGDLRQIVLSCRGLGMIAYQQGNLTQARKSFEVVLAMSRELNDKLVIAVSLVSLGDLMRTQGYYASARPYYEESLEILRQLDNKLAVSDLLNNLGAVAYDEGDFVAANSNFAEALTIAQEMKHKVAISFALDGFGALLTRVAKLESAAQLAGAAEQLRNSVGYEVEPAERRFLDSYLAELRSAIGTNFSVNYEQGRNMKLEKAIAHAFNETKVIY